MSAYDQLRFCWVKFLQDGYGHLYEYNMGCKAHGVATNKTTRPTVLGCLSWVKCYTWTVLCCTVTVLPASLEATERRTVVSAA